MMPFINISSKAIKTNVYNFPYFLKKIKRLTLGLSYMTLLTCPVKASNILNDFSDKLDDLVEHTQVLVTRKIVRPVTDSVHDFEKYAERATRPNPPHNQSLILQKVENIPDICEDIQDNVERKAIRPIKDWIKDLKIKSDKWM